MKLKKQKMMLIKTLIKDCIITNLITLTWLVNFDKVTTYEKSDVEMLTKDFVI